MGKLNPQNESPIDVTRFVPGGATSSYTANLSWAALATVASQIRSLLFIPLLMRFLGVRSYGIWAQWSVTLNLVVPLALLNLSYALTRFLPAEHHRRRLQGAVYGVLGIGLLNSFLVGLALWLFSGLLRRTIFIFPEVDVAITLLILAIPLWVSYTVFLNYFRGLRRLRVYAITEGVTALAEVAGAFWVIVLVGSDLWGFLKVLLFIRLCMVASLFLSVTRELGFGWPGRKQICQYMYFSVPLLFSHVSYWWVDAIDRYVIAYFMGMKAVGVYSAVYNISGVLRLLGWPLSLVLPPTLAAAWEAGDRESVDRHAGRTIGYLLALSLPALVGLNLLWQPILTVLTESETVQAGQPLVFLLSMSFMLYGLYWVFSQALSLTKRTYVIGVMWAGAAAVNFILNLWAVPRWGLLGAAVATLVAFGLSACLAMVIAHRIMSPTIPYSLVLKSCLASLVMGLVLELMPTEAVTSSAKLFCFIILGAGTYFIALVVMGRKELKELTRTDTIATN